MRCVKKSSATKRSILVNPLPRIATSTANTLTAITFSLKSAGGALRYSVPSRFFIRNMTMRDMRLKSSKN